MTRTPLNIFRSDKPTRLSHGRIEQMSAIEAVAWQRTRELHPHLYRRDRAR